METQYGNAIKREADSKFLDKQISRHFGMEFLRDRKN